MSLAHIAERHRIAREKESTLGATRLTIAGKAAATPILRVRTRVAALDRVTGGGFVRGGVYLLHGPPGSGKSTLLAQAACAISGSVYVSAEESEDQVGRRFVRLGGSHQLIMSERDIDAALSACGEAPFVVIDSISRYGTGAAEAVVEHAQRYRVAVAMVCHETKGGVHAGPRALEHLIDCTIKLDREPRVLTVEKNRFGPAPVSVEMEMTERGFR